MTIIQAVLTKLTKLHRSPVDFAFLSVNRPPAVQACSYNFSPSISAPRDSSSAACSQHREEELRRWKIWLLFIPGAVTFGLGTWQIFRRQEKIKLLDYRKKRLEMEPVKFSRMCPQENLESFEFRRVLCRGYFEESKSIYLGPRSRSISGVTENGYYLITPLITILDNGESLQSPVLVNRGWVPRSWRDKAVEVADANHVPERHTPSSQKGQKRPWWRFWVKNPVTAEGCLENVSVTEVTGVVRGSENPSIFVPANVPASFQWFYVDVDAIARACGLSGSVLYIEDINSHVNPSSPYPVPKDAKDLASSSLMPRDHLNYALTWYSLSAAVTYMAFRRVMPKKSRR